MDDIDGLLHDRFREVGDEDLNGGSPSMNEDARNFYKILAEASKELYPGCKGFSSLSFIIRLQLNKCLYGWSDVSVDALIKLLKEAIPNLNIPDTFAKTKAMVNALGLGYKKIDACSNDCMLYWKDDEDKDFCKNCGVSRWVVRSTNDDPESSSNKAKKIPVKVLRHFPLKARLQRLYMCERTAKMMRWHAEERTKDGKLRHPADGEAWEEFDTRHADFAEEPRNIRLGLTTDGFNPFGNMSLSYSIWPVILMPYNLPPWLCMKSEFSMLSLLIPGPKSPGQNIDVYLQPLIEELQELWHYGVTTYDASMKEDFLLKACVMWTISDFPAYAMLLGWSTSGYLACPICKYGTDSRHLGGSHKMCYMGHRKYLPEDHPYRKNKKDFNGKIELEKPPAQMTGNDILEVLEGWVNMFGTKPKRKRDIGPWRKKSIFF